MADIASRPAFAPRLAWRTIGVAFVIIAVLVAAALAFVGSQQTKLPPPFGVARNGAIAFAVDGDIFSGDPMTGRTTSLVAGPEIDGNPLFSRDGTRIAFLRQAGDLRTGPFHVVVVGRSGGAVRTLTTEPIQPDALEWSPDGASLIVNTPDARLTRYDVTGTAPPVVVAEGVHIYASRPPDGAQILYEPDGVSRTALWVMNSDGTGKRLLLQGGSDAEGGGAISGSVRYSPDGRLIAFGLNGPNDTWARIHVMNADGTGLRRLDFDPGNIVDNDLVWSPDGTRIAFNRWRENQTTLLWDILPIGVVSVDGGAVASLGPTPVPDGALFDFSPDGTTILSLPGTLAGAPSTSTKARPIEIDTTRGTSRELGWDVNSAATYQRLAP